MQESKVREILEAGEDLDLWSQLGLLLDAEEATEDFDNRYLITGQSYLELGSGFLSEIVLIFPIIVSDNSFNFHPSQPGDADPDPLVAGSGSGFIFEGLIRIQVKPTRNPAENKEAHLDKPEELFCRLLSVCPGTRRLIPCQLPLCAVDNYNQGG